MSNFRKFMPVATTVPDFAHNVGLSVSFTHKMALSGQLPSTEAGQRRLIVVAPALRAIGIDPETLLPLNSGPRPPLKITPIMKKRAAAAAAQAAAAALAEVIPKRGPGRPRKIPVLLPEDAE